MQPGASLTAFELSRHGVAHVVIADSTGGYPMQIGLVDRSSSIDRVTANDDACNKIGTYMKALASA